KRKKSRPGNILRCFPTSAYSIMNLPAGPGCPSASPPTTSLLDCTPQNRECKDSPPCTVSARRPQPCQNTPSDCPGTDLESPRQGSGQYRPYSPTPLRISRMLNIRFAFSQSGSSTAQPIPAS